MSEFEKRSAQLLRQGSDGLDAHVRSRLTQARFAAVEAARRRRNPAVWRSWLPLGGMSAAVLAVLVWSGGWQHQPVGVSPARETVQVRSPFDNLDLMTADENLEMIEDVEFYAWLDMQPAADGADITG